MGYTHYWSFDDKIAPEAWQKIMEDAKKLIVATSVKLLHDYDEPNSHPYVGEDKIWLNGAGDEGHETFVLTPKPTAFEFCKTAQKPYDLIVCAILAVAHEHAGISVRSDGDAPDWTPALVFASATLGRAIILPLEVNGGNDGAL